MIRLRDEILASTNRFELFQNGVTSICSANWYVIKAALLNAKNLNKKVLIESTSNQVNQFGGYTGFTPRTFKNKVFHLAKKIGIPYENIFLGGDHLGTNVWKNKTSDDALLNAKDQIREYIKAGFSKIHLDASMKCADDGELSKPLDSEIIADRTAALCAVSEEAYNQLNDKSEPPLYIIGSDVPAPGGGKSIHHSIIITKKDEVEKTIYLTKKAFNKYHLEKAWERVIAIVVQPGVEFNNSTIFDYQHENTIDLTNSILQFSNLVFEAHSTDFQKRDSLKQMVNDRFTILKVGPWLTFAYREAVFALAYIERELLNSKSSSQSNLLQVIENAMMERPKYWIDYYKGNKNEMRLARMYSYSDRIRYYWSEKKITSALNKLIFNLSNNEIPLSLISQFLPEEYTAICNGKISCNPEELINNKITKILDIYNYAISGNLQ